MTGAALAWNALATEAGLAAIMAIAWAVERRTGNSGWIDAFWIFGVGLLGAGLALAPSTPGAPVWRGALVATLIAVWAIRLGLRTVGRAIKRGDDLRYRALIELWGASTPMRLLGLLQLQALCGAVLATSAALAAKAPGAQVRLQDVLAAGLFVGALFGQAIADAQLARFRTDPANRGAICDIGLWRRWRRPNDVFEALAWLAFPLFAIDPACDGGFGWLALAAPLLVRWTQLHAPATGRSLADEASRAPIFLPRIRSSAR
jgi:steroid 5-alpha reductase family enzyme